jgi:hypothetical protein
MPTSSAEMAHSAKALPVAEACLLPDKSKCTAKYPAEKFGHQRLSVLQLAQALGYVNFVVVDMPEANRLTMHVLLRPSLNTSAR